MKKEIKVIVSINIDYDSDIELESAKKDIKRRFNGKFNLMGATGSNYSWGLAKKNAKMISDKCNKESALIMSRKCKNCIKFSYCQIKFYVLAGKCHEYDEKDLWEDNDRP